VGGSPVILIVSHIDPADFATNASFTGNFHRSPQYRQARTTLISEIRDVYHGGPLERRARVRIEIHDSDIDADAPVKGILDALVHARVLQDDSRQWLKGVCSEHGSSERKGLTIRVEFS
jgi:Holliday junction resolvase RusA-like endonuclease